MEEEAVRSRATVLAYLLRLRSGAPEVAVFEHIDDPEAGTQVPAGGIDPGETAAAACLREVCEEAGIEGARILAPVGVFDYLHPARHERQRRHVFALAAPANTPAEWTHTVEGGGEDRGLAFRYQWMDAAQAVVHLAGEQGMYLVAAMGDSGIHAGLRDTPLGARTAAAEDAGVSVREAEREDREALLWLWTCLGAHHRTIEPARPLRWTLRTAEERRRLIDAVWDHPDQNAFFVADAAGAVIGCVRASLSETGPCPGHIETLFVARDWRGRGVGSRLLRRACEWCRQRGAREVSVSFIAANGDARRLYERAGFQPLLATYFLPDDCGAAPGGRSESPGDGGAK